MREKWIQINTIQGFEDIREWYWLSNSDEDKVMNKDIGKQLKLRLNKDGYKVVDLRTINGKRKTCYLHTLKAKGFLFGPIPLGYNVVRHLNDVKTDNRIPNLAWGTQSDNVRDCIKNGHYNYEANAKAGTTTARRTSKPVRCIETGITYSSAKEAERLTGIHSISISYCCNGKRKTAGGYHWEFVNKRS